MNKFRPIDVANLFISKFSQTDDSLTHMKVQKLTYITHGFWLQNNECSLLTAKPEVWPYGPVFSHMFQEFKEHKGNPITKPEKATFDEEVFLSNDKELIRYIDAVWEKYGSKTGGFLSDLTHKPNTPWHKIASKYNFKVPYGYEIPDSLVQKHYREDVLPLFGT